MSGQFACAKRIRHATDVAIPDMRQGCCLTIVLHRRRHAGGMSQYLRIWVPGGTYFFTVNLLERRRTLLVDHIDALRAAFRAAHAARPFYLIAYVILPDHLHCLCGCLTATRTTPLVGGISNRILHAAFLRASA
jgi:hypothetical protein